MRTTLRFTSVVGGVAALVLLAAIILSATDWLSTPPAANQRTAGQASVPSPLATAPAPQASAPAPQPGAGAGPARAPAATVSTLRPAPAAVVVQAVVSAPQAREEPAGQLADDARADRGRGGGRGNGGGGLTAGKHDELR